VTLAPELPGALAAVAWLCARGIVVSAGHSGATYDQARAAFAAGVTMGTHLFNAMTPFHHREPGLPGALLTEPGIRASLIADGLHVHPAALRLAYAARGAAGLALVSDAMAALGMGEGRYQLSGQAVTVDAESARLADGTLAGSVVPLDAALRTMVNEAGCTVAAAVRMASQTPAEVLGLTDRGRIAAGMRADLIVLDPALRVRLTVIAGRVVWEAGS
jgi:N-acetylglucosamine-6-phosphate deacetylase